MMIIKIRRLPGGLGYDMASAIHPRSRCAVARSVGVAVWGCPLGVGAKAAPRGSWQPVSVQLQAEAAFSCSKGNQKEKEPWGWPGPGRVGVGLQQRLGPNV